MKKTTNYPTTKLMMAAAIVAVIMMTVPASGQKIKPGQVLATPVPAPDMVIVRLNDEALFLSGAWTACGAPGPVDGHVSVTASTYFALMRCIGKSNKSLALGSLSAVEKAVYEDRAFHGSARFWLTRMEIYADNGDIRTAKQLGEGANALKEQWDGAPFADEQATYWDMLPSAMRDVLRAHGGIRSDNLSARPQEWKFDGADDVWVYRTGGANVTTYVFTHGKLTRTLRA
jgi:hypothetical protein